jgi:hypothetical protein
LPEHGREPVHEPPQRTVVGVVAEGPQPFVVPGGRVAVQGQPPIGQPRLVAGELLAADRGQANCVEQLPTHAARLEVDQCGGSDVERELPMSPISGASTCVAVCFQDHSGQSGRLQPHPGRHSGQATADDGDVNVVLNDCSEHAFSMRRARSPRQVE